MQKGKLSQTKSTLKSVHKESKLSKSQNPNKQQKPLKMQKSSFQQAQAEYNYSRKQQIGTSCKIVADINAIKPLGVEGLAPNDDSIELKPGVYGIGALAIGKLKIKTETEMIKRATIEPQDSLTTRSPTLSPKTKS